VIITIDGYAGSGKSTIAKKLAEFMKYSHLDSGALYRALTWYLLSQNVSTTDETAVYEKMDSFNIEQKSDHWLVNGQDVTEEIRSIEVSEQVSNVAKIEFVRDRMSAWQKAFCEHNKNVVVEGRDSGSVVFANAPYKFFFTASAKIRARRRYLEWQSKGIEGNEDQALENVIIRDKIDTSRSHSPLIIPFNATTVDTSDMTIPQVLEHVKGLIR
jgi:CMP/dCMP kinase